MGLFLVLVVLVGLVDSYIINVMFRFVFYNSDVNDLFYRFTEKRVLVNTYAPNSVIGRRNIWISLVKVRTVLSLPSLAKVWEQIT